MIDQRRFAGRKMLAQGVELGASGVGIDGRAVCRHCLVESIRDNLKVGSGRHWSPGPLITVEGAGVVLHTATALSASVSARRAQMSSN